MAASTPICDFGWKAVDFSLPGVDGRDWSLADIRGARATLVMFICNHCPYVVGTADRIAAVCAELKGHGVGAIAINANDAANYPADSFANMKPFADRYGFGFPYVYDASQATARAYDAVCTPDFFGFDADLGLQYRGRLDSGGRGPLPADGTRDLFDAMVRVAETGQGPREQVPSMGCSIKWKAAA